MKLFTKYKQAFENWLRALIAEEVAKVSVPLHNERAALHAQLKVLDSTHRTFFEVVKPHVEVSRLTKENEELKSSIKDLHTGVTPLIDCVTKLFPRWQADAETVAADRKLQKVK